MIQFVRTGDGNEVESQHEATSPLQQDVQPEATETGYEPEEEAEQSAGLCPSTHFFSATYQKIFQLVCLFFYWRQFTIQSYEC